MKVRKFEVCVLGDSLGGLIAALMLQKQRANVAILQRRGEEFDPSTCEFLNGFALKPVLKRVGFLPTEVNAIPSLDVPLQIVFSNHRLDCYGQEERFERELVREFPENARQITQLFRESYGRLGVYQHLFNSRVPLPPKGFFARRQFKKSLEQVVDLQLLADRQLEKELKSFDVGDEFSRAVQAMELSLSHLITPWTCGARLAHLLTLVRWEGYDAADGLATIRKLLLRRLKERGGVVAEYDELKEVAFSGNTVTGFIVTGGEWSEIACETTILGGDPRGLICMDEQNRHLRKWRTQLDKLPVYSRKVYMTYRVHPQGIPIGMQPQGLIVPDGPPSGVTERRRAVRAVRYVIRKHEGPGGKPETRLGLTAFLPPGEDVPKPEHVAEEVREAVLRVIPFLEEYLLEEPGAPFVPTVQGRAGDFRQGLIYTSKDPRILGIIGSPIETPLKNVYLAGDMAFPGLGLDGEIMAGLQAAHYAGEHLKKYSKPETRL